MPGNVIKLTPRIELGLLDDFPEADYCRRPAWSGWAVPFERRTKQSNHRNETGRVCVVGEGDKADTQN